MHHTMAVCPQCRALNKAQSDKALKGEAVCGKCQTKLDFHGLVSQVNTADFQRIIQKSDAPVIVDFWASWCGPCRSYGPEFEKASHTTPAVFLKVNTESEQALSGQLGIRGIPCTIVFKGGKEVKRQSGAMSAAQVAALVAEVR